MEILQGWVDWQKLVANDVHTVRRTTPMRQVGPEEKAYSLTLSLSFSQSSSSGMVRCQKQGIALSFTTHRSTFFTGVTRVDTVAIGNGHWIGERGRYTFGEKTSWC
jgi:hypothetical protein